MNSWSVYRLVVLALLFAPESRAGKKKNGVKFFQVWKFNIDPDQIVFNISNTLHGITITWRTPNDEISPNCYDAEVQYKSQCVKDWKRGRSIQTRQEHEVYNVNMSTLSMKTNYDFRIRMKLWCIKQDWSNWTKVQSWGNNEGSCIVEASSYIWVYILITALPLTTFLLVCLLTQQGVRRLIFPEVPDPKNFKNKIMDTEHFQWWGNLTQRNEECSTADIEIIDKNEMEEQEQTLVIQPMYASPEQQDGTYRIYSPETPGEITELQYSRSVLGYIAL